MYGYASDLGDGVNCSIQEELQMLMIANEIFFYLNAGALAAVVFVQHSGLPYVLRLRAARAAS